MAVDVLIAFDGSAAAEAAVRAAGALFSGARATVLTIHEPAIGPATAYRVGGGVMSPEVVQESLSELERERVGEATAVAAGGSRLAEEVGLAAEPEVAPATPPRWQSIVTVARDRGADVLVCGSRGHGAVARSVLGSVSSSLLHHAETAVLVVPDSDVSLDGPALIAYDGSPAANAAIAATGRLVPGRPAVVVHVWESPVRHSMSGRALSGAPVREVREFTEDFDTWFRQMAEATARDGAELAKEAGLDASAEAVESGSAPWRALRAAAETRDAAVVVVGSQGHGRVASVLLGSVSAGLVHHAERPVLVIPHSERRVSRPERPR